MLMDPLILAGARVVPAVIDAVADRDMPNRRYAILFLGNGRYRDALPRLADIVDDETEPDYFRGDALSATYQIDRERGVALAREHARREDYLGRIARDIARGTHQPPKRSYLAAVLGIHN